MTVKGGNKGLQGLKGVTSRYKRLRWVTWGYMVLKRFKEFYKGLLGDKRESSGLQEVTGGYMGLQGITVGYGGLQGVTGVRKGYMGL